MCVLFQDFKIFKEQWNGLVSYGVVRLLLTPAYLWGWSQSLWKDGEGYTSWRPRAHWSDCRVKAMRGVGWLARLISCHVSQVLRNRTGPREPGQWGLRAPREDAEAPRCGRTARWSEHLWPDCSLCVVGPDQSWEFWSFLPPQWGSEHTLFVIRGLDGWLHSSSSSDFLE